MDFVRGLINLRPRHRGAVLTIGAFDGLHRGHQALLARTIELARQYQRPSMMLTFEPMPREVLASNNPPARLTSLRERWDLLSAGAVSALPDAPAVPDALCVLRFSKSLQAMHGDEFVRTLHEVFAVHAVIVGHDYRYGRSGTADCAMLTAAGRARGFAVEVLPPVRLGAERVSSSAVREALAASRFDAAAELLGRRYSMRGRVVTGQKLGRTLGFPTANLRLERLRSPLQGIFAVRARELPSGGWMTGVASLGTRPTVGGTEPLLETHLFDYSGDLYGRAMEVEFVCKLREELKFASLEAMTAQMHRDAQAARAAAAPLSH